MRFKRIIAVLLILAIGVGAFYYARGGPPPPPPPDPGDEDGFVEIQGTVYAGEAVVSGARITCGSLAISTITDADGYYYLKFAVGTICHTNLGLTVPPYQLAAQHNDYGLMHVSVDALDNQIVTADIHFDLGGGTDDPLDGIARVFVRVLDLCDDWNGLPARLDPEAFVKAGWVTGILVDDGWYKLEFGYHGATNLFITAGAPNHVTTERLFGTVSDTQKLYVSFPIWETGATSC